MDIWVVAAAAGAGYIAQHWKSILKGRQDIPCSSAESPTFATSEKNCPLRRVVAGKKIGKDTYLDREVSAEDLSVVEVASTSGSEVDNLPIMDASVNLSIAILNENLQGGGERFSENKEGFNGDLSPQPSTKEIGFSYDPARRKRALRSQRSKRQLIKPLSSLESCLMAQLYNENAETEEYVFNSSYAPRAPMNRPFLVTDGSRIISRGSLKAAEKQPEDKASSGQKTVYGVPQLPEIKLQQEHFERSSNWGRVANGKLHKLQGPDNSHKLDPIYSLEPGSSHGALLFCLGISVGILSSFLGNRQEVHKLDKLLKQTENLVQDLQEELEMKDSLTVKELAIEEYGSQHAQNDSFYEKPLHAFSPEHKLDESTEHDRSKYHDEKVEEKSLSKIEAELEAELERLELSMTVPRLERRFTDLVELDPDFVPDVAVGELRADLFGREASTQHYADEDGSGSSTVHSANYAVSPRELSLRLHEVVQSRLEERVKELETALQNSQKKVKYINHEHMINSWRNLSSSEVGSSVQRSPVNHNEQLHSDHPVVINLTGEALDAYNEAYDLFAKINDSEEDKTLKINGSSDIKCLSPHQVEKDWLGNGIQSHISVNGLPSEYREEEVQNNFSNDMGTSGDESDRDEMEELLIKHIVEKAKKSSSVILNAQRVLFLNDEK